MAADSSPSPAPSSSAPTAAQPVRQSTTYLSAALNYFFPPSLPPAHLPVHRIPALIPSGTIFNCLFHAYVDIPGSSAPSPSYSLYWEGWMESWYQMFDERMWEMLSKDDRVDREALRERLARCPVLRNDPETDARELSYLEEEIMAYQAILHVRLEKFYALHYVRTRFLSESPQYGRPNKAELLERLPSGDIPFCSHPPQSVWPSDFCPYSKTSRTDPAVPLVRLSPLRPAQLIPYFLPSVDSPEATAANALWRVDPLKGILTWEFAGHLVVVGSGKPTVLMGKKHAE